jgi:hypothetical protein
MRDARGGKNGGLRLPPNRPLGRRSDLRLQRERYPHGEGGLIYLARYVRGGPLANQRLVSCVQGEVRFRY